MSLEALKSFFEWGGIALLALTVFVGAGALLVNNRLSKGQEDKLRQFDRDLTSAKTELSKQQERTAHADARVAGLEQDVSNAKTEMAKQQTRAATAELALLELQTRLAHRRITPSERTKMAAKLRPYAGSIVAITKVGEAEAGQFADDLILALHEAKWDVKLNINDHIAPTPYWMRCLIDTRSKAGRALADVLRPLPTADVREAFHDPPHDQLVGTILVGLRPPA